MNISRGEKIVTATERVGRREINAPLDWTSLKRCWKWWCGSSVSYSVEYCWPQLRCCCSCRYCNRCCCRYGRSSAFIINRWLLCIFFLAIWPKKLQKTKQTEKTTSECCKQHLATLNKLSRTWPMVQDEYYMFDVVVAVVGCWNTNKTIITTDYNNNNINKMLKN